MSEHLLPPNATPAERALSEAVARISDVPVRVRDVWSPSNCPSALLPWLAWAFSVDEWDAAWTDEQKRDTIQSSVQVHRYKGTIGAVRSALAALGVIATVQEWFNQDPHGDPYTFRILLESEQTGVPLPLLDKLLAVLDRTKNLRSHLELIEVSAVTAAGPTVAMVCGVGSDLALTNYVSGTVAMNETNLCM